MSDVAVARSLCYLGATTSYRVRTVPVARQRSVPFPFTDKSGAKKRLAVRRATCPQPLEATLIQQGATLEDVAHCVLSSWRSPGLLAPGKLDDAASPAVYLNGTRPYFIAFLRGVSLDHVNARRNQNA